MINKLKEPCAKLISYWKRNKTNWQLEKAEDFLRQIEEVLDEDNLTDEQKLKINEQKLKEIEEVLNSNEYEYHKQIEFIEDILETNC